MLPTTQDPALTKPTFSHNQTLTAALARIAARKPKPVISGAETDGSDASPEPTTQTKTPCMICESKETVITLYGYFAHEEFSICKSCARLAATLDGGDLLNFQRKVVKAEQRRTRGK